MKKNLKTVLDNTFQDLETSLDQFKFSVSSKETGTVTFVGEGIARIKGLPHLRSIELVRFAGQKLGMAFNLNPEEVGVVLLDPGEEISVGSTVRRTGRVADVPVGEAVLGRVMDALGRPLDENKPIRTEKRREIEQPAPGILDRLPVNIPLQTGIKVIDALIPIGRGQRELIVGDRQTGKTAVAVDTVIHQKDTEVICIYCAIGQKQSDVAKIIATFKEHSAMDYTLIIIARGDDPPGLQYLAPYSAMTMGESFMKQGKDVLIILDDLTKHARSYRELSLLLRRPPAREAYPGDIFYIHSRLLERSTNLKDEQGGGSITTLPVVETQAQNISAYIPTNLISITDGQIYLSPDLFHKGILPAVDVGRSVSRVGGKTQLPAYREVAGDLRLSYSQFEEVEKFARYSTRLDEETRKTLKRGRRVREVLKQNRFQTLGVPEQISILLAVTKGLFDNTDIEFIHKAEPEIQKAIREELPDICQYIEEGKTLNDEQVNDIQNTARQVIEGLKQENNNADSGSTGQ